MRLRNKPGSTLVAESSRLEASSEVCGHQILVRCWMVAQAMCLSPRKLTHLGHTCHDSVAVSHANDYTNTCKAGAVLVFIGWITILFRIHVHIGHIHALNAPSRCGSLERLSVSNARTSLQRRRPPRWDTNSMPLRAVAPFKCIFILLLLPLSSVDATFLHHMRRQDALVSSRPSPSVPSVRIQPEDGPRLNATSQGQFGVTQGSATSSMASSSSGAQQNTTQTISLTPPFADAEESVDAEFMQSTQMPSAASPVSASATAAHDGETGRPAAAPPPGDSLNKPWDERIFDLYDLIVYKLSSPDAPQSLDRQAYLVLEQLVRADDFTLWLIVGIVVGWALIVLLLIVLVLRGCFCSSKHQNYSTLHSVDDKMHLPVHNQLPMPIPRARARECECNSADRCEMHGSRASSHACSRRSSSPSVDEEAAQRSADETGSDESGDHAEEPQECVKSARPKKAVSAGSSSKRKKRLSLSKNVTSNSRVRIRGSAKPVVGVLTFGGAKTKHAADDNDSDDEAACTFAASRRRLESRSRKR